jgi:hypothetical protein
MRRRIVTQICLYFHDSPGQHFPALATKQDLPEQVTRNPPRIAIIESARQGWQFAQSGGRGQGHGSRGMQS